MLVVLTEERLSDSIKHRKQLTKSEQICIFKWSRQTVCRTHHWTEGDKALMFQKLAAEGLINYIKQKDPKYMQFHGHRRALAIYSWLSTLSLCGCCICCEWSTGSALPVCETFLLLSQCVCFVCTRRKLKLKKKKKS